MKVYFPNIFEYVIRPPPFPYKVSVIYSENI